MNASPEVADSAAVDDCPAPADRAAINRANAQHSTGPNTPAGKAAVAVNALQHGLYSQTALLPTESREHFDAAFARLVSIQSPATAEQEDLVRALHECTWRLARIRQAETGVLTLAVRDQAARFENEPGLPEAGGLALGAAYESKARLLEQFRRHERQLERQQQSIEKRLDGFKQEIKSKDRAAERAAATEYNNGLNRQIDTAIKIMKSGFVPAELPQTPPPAAAQAGPPPPALVIPHFTGPMRDIKRRNWIRKHAPAA